jgi:lipopolysaccharide export system permease protein
MFRITRIVINKGAEWTIVFELIGHIAISFLPMSIPLSVLFASMYTLNKMSEDSEIIAMRSFGLTKWKLFTPFLVLGVCISVAIFSLNQKLIPFSKTKFKNTIIRLTSKGMLTDIKAENFFTEIPGVTLFAEKVKNDGRDLENVFIQKKSGKQNSVEQVIMAKRGTLIKKAKDKWSIPAIRFHLEEGNIIKSSPNSTDIEKVIFKEYDFPITSGQGLNSFVTKDSMRTNAELIEVMGKYTAQLKKYERPKLSAHEINDQKNLIKSLNRTKLEYWTRFNTPIQCLIFVFLGFALGIKKGRGKSSNTGLVGMLVLVLYYVIFFTGVSFAKKGQISPIITVFTPSLLAMLAGAHFYRKLDWAS